MRRSPPGEFSSSIIKKEDMIIRKEETDFAISSVSTHLDSNPHEPIEVSSSLLSSSLEEDDETDDGNGESDDNTSKQLVLYDPSTNGTSQIEPLPDPLKYHPPFTSYLPPNSATRVLPSVGAFTVQCAKCFKWRLIPTQEKYEEIREHILEVPFVCETAREWRPDISCDDPADISQDGSRLWAIDKPNIAQPPQGWQRILHIRGEGCTKFADIYYKAPSGKRLRSMVEIEKYLLAHPEYLRDGVTMSQFSFLSPKPLQENYVRKRPPRLTSSFYNRSEGMPRKFISSEVNPLSWAGPEGSLELKLASSGPSNPRFESPNLYQVDHPVKKKARETASQQMYSSNPADKVKV